MVSSDMQFVGRRAGGRCVAPKLANRAKPRCTRLVLLRGSFVGAAKSGGNRFRFTGRLGGRKLVPGAYELRATPRAAVHDGATGHAAFRIVG